MTVDEVGEELADIAAAVLEAALAVARAELPPGATPARLAVVAMGKCGGRELNYASDIDVIFVAEPVKESTRRVYSETFGVRILEGYGATETAPAVAFNTPMFYRNGSVGRILPGMEARLEHVEGVDEGGRLYVRGPNVMLGYLKADNPGVLERPVEGWHDTGDIVTIDEQGFLTIKGRARRFAKVGGEMISLAAVEALAAELWPNALSAVVALPDPRRGERLILLTQQSGATRVDFQNFAKAKHASDFMIPSEIWVLDKLPVLATGKADMVAVGKLVEERLAAKADAMARASA